jgi:hypothetical protein
VSHLKVQCFAMSLDGFSAGPDQDLDNPLGVVDFESCLVGPVFELLKDRAYFRKFFLDGGTVAWPNGAGTPLSTSEYFGW